MTDRFAPLPERWYCVSRDGLATLCRDADDARMLAAQCDTDYPRQAPHRPVLMGDVAALCAQTSDTRPIVKLSVGSDGRIAGASFYCPGLPPGVHDLWRAPVCADWPERVREAHEARSKAPNAEVTGKPPRGAAGSK